MAQATPDISYKDMREYCWSKGNLSYLLWDQQLPIYEGIRSLKSNVDEAVMVVARQFGKSFLECILASEDCLLEKDCCVPIFGPTIEQCRDIVNPRMEAIKRECPFTNTIRRMKSEDKWIVGSSEIQICGFDVNSSSNRGKTVKRDAYVEEVVDSSPDRFLESMRSDIGPALTHSKTGRIIYATTLPKIPDHPFITTTIPKAKLADAFWTYTIYDNKKLSRDQFIKCAKRAGCKVDDDGNILEISIDWRREFLCEVVRDGSVTVIPDFDRRLHVRTASLPPSANFEVFIDFGGTRDRTVALLTFYDFNSNKLRVYDERNFDPNTSTKVIVEGCREMEGQFNVTKRWADCHGQTSVDLMELGYEISPVLKTDWQASVNNLQTMFRLGQVEIDPRCKLTIVTCDSGQFNKQRTDFSRDSRELGHCDAIAALMYAARCFDRGNPYPEMERQVSSKRFYRPSEDDLELSSIVAPKVFGDPRKKFGSFR